MHSAAFAIRIRPPSPRSARDLISPVLESLISRNHLPNHATLAEFGPSSASIEWTEPNDVQGRLFFCPIRGSFESVRPSRLIIRGTPDQDHLPHLTLNDPNASITVKPSRDARSLANDIARRVLPVLRLNIAETYARRQIHLTRLAEQDNLLNQLKDSFSDSVSDRSDLSSSSCNVAFGSDGNPVFGSAKLVANRRFSFQFTCSRSAALEVARFIAKLNK